MRSFTFATILLAVTVISMNQAQATDVLSVYSSFGRFNTETSVSIRGLDDGGFISGGFLDNDQNGAVDAFTLELFDQNGMTGNLEAGFSIDTINGTRLLSFPITNSNNFLGLSDFLDNFPANTEIDSVLIPVTDDNRFELTIADGTPLLAFDLDIEADENNGGNGNGNPPPSDFEINLGLAGAWFNPATAGQGFLIDLLADEQFIFITWYTFTPDGQQQWFTAAGNFQGNRVELNVIEATGGIFNEPSEVTREIEGSVIAEFTDCLNGTIEFDITEFGLTGVIPITRIAGDQICQDLTDGNLVLP